MSQPKKKLYIVKREVLATSLSKALTSKGTVVSADLVADYQPALPKKSTGFKKN